jgi:CheY-like chemotaxis protein
MRVLIVDDSPPRRHLLTTVLRSAGHETLTAANGAVALGILETEPVDAVVSDVKMPRVDGFELCRAIRRDARLRPIPFIFYSSVFTGGAAHEFGMDLGATAYIDAKRVLPNKLASEIEQVVSRIVSAEYREALVRLHDDLEFARRYHAVVLSVSDTSAERGGPDNLASGVDELDHLLSRLDTERVTLAGHQDVIVPIAELNRLRDLSDHLREAMNRPLAATDGPSALSDDAAASVRGTVRRINKLVRKLGARKHVTTPTE